MRLIRSVPTGAVIRRVRCWKYSIRSKTTLTRLARRTASGTIAAGLLTGSARIAAESVERAAAQGLSLESEELANALENRRETVNAHVATLQADFAAEERLTQRLIAASQQRQEAVRQDQLAQGRRRSVKRPESEP